MNVWRGFTLTIWVLLLATTLTISLVYHSLSTTLLDPRATEQRLVKDGVYGAVRDTILTNKIMTQLQERYPGNTLVDSTMVRTSLAQALPDQTLAERADPAVTTLYNWLDSKRENPSFSVDISDVKDDFYKSFEKQLHAKVTSIDSCGDNRYPPEDALLKDRCLPAYVSADEATQAIMGSIRATDPSLGSAITDETVFGSTLQTGRLNQLPSYLNMLWSLNLLALVVSGILVLLLLVTRRILGVAAIGIAAIVGGFAAWIGGGLIRSIRFGELSPELASTVKDVLVAPFGSSLVLSGLITLAVGLGLVVIAIALKRYRSSRA